MPLSESNEQRQRWDNERKINIIFGRGCGESLVGPRGLDAASGGLWRIRKEERGKRDSLGVGRGKEARLPLGLI